jgi:hypothetical protein
VAHPQAREDRQWFALRTKSRREKVLSEDMRPLGIGHFLPLIRVVRFYGNRKATLPRISLPAWRRRRRLPGRAHPLCGADYRGSRLQNELKNIALAISKIAALDAYPYLKNWRRVKFRSGRLRGLQAFVVDRNQRNRLILNMETRGTAVSVEIDPSLVDLLE